MLICSLKKQNLQDLSETLSNLALRIQISITDMKSEPWKNSVTQ